MDRFQANKEIGNIVLIDEKNNGKYIGELLKVITIPKKPWRGLVKIVSIFELPKQNWENGVLELNMPLYKEGETVEVSGTKIKPYTLAEEPVNYRTSVSNGLHSLIEQHKDFFAKNPEAYARLEKIIMEKFPDIQFACNSSSKSFNQTDERYIEFIVKQVDGNPLLINDLNNQLPLEDCPFELELKVDQTWIKGHYTQNWLFEGENGKKYLIRQNDHIRLAKEHLKPYQLFLNELEKPALESLENSLNKFGLSHHHLINCHNELLLQLLAANGEKKFSGVNFLFYQKGVTTVVIQHHYERQLVDHGNDIIYDRFEITSNRGKRCIVTYTNEFTKDR